MSALFRADEKRAWNSYPDPPHSFISVTPATASAEGQFAVLTFPGKLLESNIRLSYAGVELDGRIFTAQILYASSAVLTRTAVGRYGSAAIFGFKKEAITSITLFVTGAYSPVTVEYRILNL